MNSTKNKEIEFLAALDALIPLKIDLLEFLLLEKLINKETVESIKRSATPYKDMQTLLSVLQKTDKFQLLEYSWQVLPKAHLKLIIVTDRVTKEFEFSGV